MSELPPDFLVKRKIYHGTNTPFEEFDFNRSGGMVNFTENPSNAWGYANDLGSGSRNRLRWKDIAVEDLDTGIRFHYDPDSRLWTSLDGKEKIPFEEFKEMMDEGERYFEAYPKYARVIERQATLNNILDTHPNRSEVWHRRANKKGLEEVIDVINPQTIGNHVPPQHADYAKAIADRLRRSAIDELKDVPGAPGFGNTFWTTTKNTRSPEVNESVKGVVSQLKESGRDGIRFADDSHPTIAMFKDPEKSRTLYKGAKKLPFLGMGLTALGAASYSDAAGAAVDAIIPGGVEELGVSDEQRELDRRYREILKQRSQ